MSEHSARERSLINRYFKGSSSTLVHMGRWLFRGGFAVFIAASLWWFLDTVYTVAPPDLGTSVVLAEVPPTPSEEISSEPDLEAQPTVPPPEEPEALPPIPDWDDDWDDDDWDDDDWDDDDD